MNGFKNFINEATEEEKNVRDTLKKVPKKHTDLIKGYKYRWQAGCTLKGDDEHIGIINPNTKTITIAAPWRYGREFTLLHELAHQVWAAFVDEKHRKEWKGIVARTKHKMKQNDEELFAMSYADHFASNKIVIHHHPEWNDFVKKIIKLSS